MRNKQAIRLALSALEAEASIYKEHDSEDGCPWYLTEAIFICKIQLAESEEEPIGEFAAYGQQLWLYPGAAERMPTSGKLYTSPYQKMSPPIYSAFSLNPTTKVVMVADLKRFGIEVS